MPRSPRSATTTDGVGLTLSYVNGAAAYLRLATPAGGNATLTFSSGGNPPPSTMLFTIVRTK